MKRTFKLIIAALVVLNAMPSAHGMFRRAGRQFATRFASRFAPRFARFSTVAPRPTWPVSAKIATTGLAASGLLMYAIKEYELTWEKGYRQDWHNRYDIIQKENNKLKDEAFAQSLYLDKILAGGGKTRAGTHLLIAAHDNDINKVKNDLAHADKINPYLLSESDLDQALKKAISQNSFEAARIIKDYIEKRNNKEETKK